MNKTRRENNYKYYCTSDPATWETNKMEAQELPNMDTQKIRGDKQEYKGARGNYGGMAGGKREGGKRGEGKETQRVLDKGWEGRRTEMKNKRK